MPDRFTERDADQEVARRRATWRRRRARWSRDPAGAQIRAGRA